MYEDYIYLSRYFGPWLYAVSHLTIKIIQIQQDLHLLDKIPALLLENSFAVIVILLMTNKPGIILNSCQPTGAAAQHWNTMPLIGINFVSIIAIRQAQQLQHI